MKIETSFNVGDLIWYMHHDKPKEETVRSIEVIVRNEYRAINYTTTSSFFSNDEKVVNETKAFGSKEELLDSFR